MKLNTKKPKKKAHIGLANKGDKVAIDLVTGKGSRGPAPRDHKGPMRLKIY